MQAVVELVQRQGGIVVRAACIIEPAHLKGRSRVAVLLTAIISCDSEAAESERCG